VLNAHEDIPEQFSRTHELCVIMAHNCRLKFVRAFQTTDFNERAAHCRRPPQSAHAWISSVVVAGVGDLHDQSNVLLSSWNALRLPGHLLALIHG